MSGYSLTLAEAAEGTSVVDAMGWSDWAANALFVDELAGLSAARRWRRWALTASLPHPKWAGRLAHRSAMALSCLAMSFACTALSCSCTGGPAAGGGAARFLSAAKLARKASNLALAASSGESVVVDIRKGVLVLAGELTAVSHRS